MLRDTRADEKYFSEYIQRQERYISSLEEAIRLEKRPLLFNPDRYETLFSMKLWIFKALYSRGEELDVLRERYEELIGDFKECWDRSCVDIVDFTSLAILLEVKDEDIKKIADVSKEIQIGTKIKEDRLVNFLLHSRLPEVEYKDVPFALPKFYGMYGDIMESENPAEELYLFVRRRWYTSRKCMGWWGSHLRLENYTYHGYWNYEAAAIVKIMGLDDTRLKECVYYPYDLAHYQR